MDDMRDRIDRHDRLAGDQFDRAFGPEMGGAKGQRLAAFLARQIVFGEWRALIGEVGFLAKQRDRAGETELAKHDRRLCAGVARTDNQDIPMHVLHPHQHVGGAEDDGRLARQGAAIAVRQR